MIFLWVFMVSITCALYLGELLEYFSPSVVQILLVLFLSLLPVFLAATGLALIVVAHRAYIGNFLRLRAAIFSIWAACLALWVPVLLYPVMAVIGACAFAPKQQFDCWSFDSINIIRETEILMMLVAALAGGFGIALTFAFLYGWYLLGRDLFEIYRGRTPAAGTPAIETPEPPPATRRLSHPRAQFGLRDG